MPYERIDVKAATEALDAAAERLSAAKTIEEAEEAFSEREKIQKEEFKLPLLPTTTIGSFPQTSDVRQTRASYKKANISL